MPIPPSEAREFAGFLSRRGMGSQLKQYAKKKSGKVLAADLVFTKQDPGRQEQTMEARRREWEAWTRFKSVELTQ